MSSSSSSSSSSTNVSFRLHGTNLFLTYPQCSILPTDAEDIVKRKLKNYEWSIWGKELHEDGSPHLHAFIRLTKPCDLRTPTCLDIIGGGLVSHGNYQVARDPKACLDYVVKGGQVECFNTTLDAARTMFTAAGRKRNATELIMEELQAGKDLTEVARDHPEHMTFIVLHSDRIEKFFAQTLVAATKPKLTFVKAVPKCPDQPMPWDLGICQWLNQNIGQHRAFSQKQLWVYGPTCHGKTSLLIRLGEMLRIYTVSKENFYDEYKDTLYDLIIFDEYHAEKTIQWMNSFCDGSVFPLAQKGKQTVKRVNHPIIVMSNLSMRQCYHKVDQSIFDTLYRRFEEIALGAPLEIAVETTPRDTPASGIN